MSRWNLNALFVPDLLGRPNYWCPELYSSSSSGNAPDAVGKSSFRPLEVYLLPFQDFFCQFPRFSIHGPAFQQRSPVSVYMRYDAVQNFTYYIISASESEECVTSFKNLLNLVSHDSTDSNQKRVLFQHPLEPHILLSKILCESSQPLINFFRQSMFAQVLIIYIHSPSNAENILAATSSGRALRSKDRQP